MCDKDGKYFEKKIHHYPMNGGQKCYRTSRFIYKEKQGKTGNNEE